MINKKKITCVIPARLKSTRFPRKMLAMLKDRPLLQWVWNSACKVPFFDDVVFAIDAEETARLIRSFGGKYLMTSESCMNGTERLIELLEKGLVDADIWVNWQGDEPFIHEQMIRDLLQSCDDEESDVWTLKKKITKMEEVTSPQFAKIVCDHQGYALCFSRSQIPYYRDETDPSQKIFYKHVGLYAFTSGSLRKISRIEPCAIEVAEQLEQLRFLYHNLRIRVHETQYEVFGIDLPEHLALAEAHIEKITS
ncbi:MAG: 3-deoxy-manno-octulosonate cytidylyltransferase [Rhabdochlamydiaceae bacterium]|jgi:3-deoxy-D-manno-octulosonate cytidylyltransferase